MIIAKGRCGAKIGFLENLTEVIWTGRSGLSGNELGVHFITGKTTKALTKFAGEKCVDLAGVFPGRDVEYITSFCV